MKGAIDDEEQPLTDAERVKITWARSSRLRGRTIGFEGADLSILIELFVGHLAETALYGQDVAWSVSNAGAFLFVGSKWFSSREACCARIEAFIGHVRSIGYRDIVPTKESMHGGHIIRFGEPEYEVLLERWMNRIPFDTDAIAASSDIADDLGTRRNHQSSVAAIRAYCRSS